MSMLPSEQKQLTTPVARQRMRRILAVAASLCILITLILNNLGIFHNPWSTILSAIFSALTLILSLPFSPDALRWIFFSSPSGSDHYSAISSPSALLPAIKTTSSWIRREPPSTNLEIIQKRESVVKEIYEELQQTETNAIVLTGITGSGKTTVAALLYEHAEAQRRIHSGPFTVKTLWFGFDNVSDPAAIMIAFSRQLWLGIGKRISNFGSSDLYNPWQKLIKEFQETKKHRLIIIDHFDDFLDWRTGSVLPNCDDIGEWISEMNSRKCNCRFLFTSRAYPQAMKPSQLIKEYHLNCFQIGEGVELLHKLGVTAIDTDGSNVVERCAGHPLTLITLAVDVLKGYQYLTFLADPKLTRTRMEEIAHYVFDRKYTQTFMQDQEMLNVVLALSIYREPVSFDSLQALIVPKMAEAKIRTALKVLHEQQLLLHDIPADYYQFHPIFSDYVCSYCKGYDELIQNLCTLHGRAAQEYLKQVAIDCPPPGKRQYRSDISSLVEAVWHQCQSGQYQEAYDLILQENFFTDLHRWGDNMILLELYQFLIPMEKWQPDPSQSALIYNQLKKIYVSLGQQELALKYDKLAKANVKRGKL